MMRRLGAAIDIGSSGLRGQALDLATGEVLSTAITTRHPLPGANVMDHVHFALEMGVETARSLLVRAVNRLLAGLRARTSRPRARVARVAVCGNPIQLSIFQGLEIRDFAFAGKKKLERLGVVPPRRDAVELPARALPGLELPDDCLVTIPPAVRHEVGADALALAVRSGMLEQSDTAVAIDYGTNAEILLFHQGRVFCGSTAAGPALEGQQLSHGMLAAPGAISDVLQEGALHRLSVLDENMAPVRGPLADMRGAGSVERGDGAIPVGVTGTGVIAAVQQAGEAGLLALPRINTPDGALHLYDGIVITNEDILEAGKAFGAVRAGLITLCDKAGIDLKDVGKAYMAGASGTYVDAVKAQKLGLLPPQATQVLQVGNTSLAMARALLTQPTALDEMRSLAERFREGHCMFATSQVFAKVFLLEHSFWTEGMPMKLYRKFLKKYGLRDLPPVAENVEVFRHGGSDLGELGQNGLETIHTLSAPAVFRPEGCVFCGECAAGCPESAISMDEQGASPALFLAPDRCAGVACRRCERICPEQVFQLEPFFRVVEKGAKQD